MSEQPKAPQGSAAAAEPSLTWKQVNAGQKALHLLKVMGFILSGGFAFPHVFDDP